MEIEEIPEEESQQEGEETEPPKVSNIFIKL
jgi:hypothetical protein